MSGPLSLEGPFFNTLNWDKDFYGVHPVEMLARGAYYVLAKLNALNFSEIKVLNLLPH